MVVGGQIKNDKTQGVVDGGFNAAAMTIAGSPLLPSATMLVDHLDAPLLCRRLFHHHQRLRRQSTIPPYQAVRQGKQRSDIASVIRRQFMSDDCRAISINWDMQLASVSACRKRLFAKVARRPSKVSGEGRAGGQIARFHCGPGAYLWQHGAHKPDRRRLWRFDPTSLGGGPAMPPIRRRWCAPAALRAAWR